MPGPNKNFGDINADKVGSKTNPNKEGNFVELPNKVFNAYLRGDQDVAAGFNDITANETPPFGIRIPAGEYTLSDSLDLTGFRSEEIYVDARGASLDASSAIDGYPMLDVTDTLGNIHWYGGELRDGGNSPAFGVLEARDSETSRSASQHNWYGLRTRGSFTKAHWYVLGSEVNQYFGCDMLSEGGGSGTTDPAVLAVGSEDFLGATSKFASPGGGVCTQNSWYGGSARSQDEVAIPDTVCLSAEIGETSFYRFFVAGGTDSGFRFRSEDRAAKMSGPITLHEVRVEGQPTNTLHVTGSNDLDRLTITDGHYTSGTNLIKADSELSRLQLDGCLENINGNPITADSDLTYISGNFEPIPSLNVSGVVDTSFMFGIAASDISSSLFHTITIPYLDTNNRPRIEITHSGDTVIYNHLGVTYPKFDLSGTTGDRVGEVRHDDGTNTVGDGLPCTWTGSAWQPHDGSATFT